MTRTLRGVLFILALFGPASLLGQEAIKQRIDHGTATPALKGYTTPESFKLEVVTTAPLTNPVDLGFTSTGEPVVLERAADKKKNNLDTIRLLTSPKEGAPWSEAVDLAKAEGVGAVLASGDWVYTALLDRLERSRLPSVEAKAPPQKIASGFAKASGGVTGMSMGPDGWLYVAVAAGDHHVKGSDDSKTTVLGTGAIFRCKPDGGSLQVVARGLAHPTAPTWDSLGHAYFADREEQGGRVLHLLDGSDYGYTLPTTKSSPVPEAQRKELFDPFPASAPKLVRAGGSAPTAVLAPIEARFPGEYRALLLVADPARHAVTALSLDTEGSTFSVGKSFDLIHSTNKAFTPTALSVGPDGALYVLDGQAKGRLLRLTWTGFDAEEGLALRPLDTWQKLLKGSDEDLLAALSTPEASDRRLAAEELVRRGDKNLPALLKLACNDDESVLARLAAWSAAVRLWNEEVHKSALTLAAGRDDAMRRVAVLALGLRASAGHTRTQNVLLKLLNDGDPTTRRAVTVAMGQVGADGAADALVNTLIADEGRDPAYSQGLVYAIELLGKRGIDRMVSVGESGVDAEIARIVQTFAGLRTRPAAEALPKLLLNPHLNVRQRTTLIRTLPRYRVDPPLDLDPVADHFEAMPDEPTSVKLAALEALALASTPKLTPKVKTWLPTLLKEKDATVSGTALRTLASLDRAAAKASVADLSAEALAELKKAPGAAEVLRDLEK